MPFLMMDPMCPCVLQAWQRSWGFMPRRQFDHGTMVFLCQPWLTTVDCGTTVVCDRGPVFGY